MEFQGKKKKNIYFKKLIGFHFRSDYIHRMLSSTSWNSALTAGKHGVNCAKAFSTCKLSPENLESFSNKLMKFARRK